MGLSRIAIRYPNTLGLGRWIEKLRRLSFEGFEFGLPVVKPMVSHVIILAPSKCLSLFENPPP